MQSTSRFPGLGDPRPIAPHWRDASHSSWHHQCGGHAARADVQPSPIEERLAQAAAYLGIGSSFDAFYAYVGELNAALNIPENLTVIGVSNPNLDHLTAAVLKDPSVGGNSVAMTAENTRALFEACF